MQQTRSHEGLDCEAVNSRIRSNKFQEKVQHSWLSIMILKFLLHLVLQISSSLNFSPVLFYSVYHFQFRFILVKALFFIIYLVIELVF